MSTLTAVLANGDRICRAPACGTLIKRFEDCFIDELAKGTTYCERCGVMLRFHRKRAVQRGEGPPITFEQVDARMKR